MTRTGAGGAARGLFHFAQFDPAVLAARRGPTRVSVCIPARDEQPTVGLVVEQVVHRLTAAGGGVDLVDEVVVVDDGSTDETAARASEAGATVVSSGKPGGLVAVRGLVALSGSGRAGKGAAMAAGVAATTGDVVAFLDADVSNFDAHFVTGLVGPLLEDPDLVLVKAFYERPLRGEAGEGGRVTELVARPLIELLFAELSHVRQPLAGETAVRRRALDGLALEPGYGVELGLLVDLAERFGVRAVAQVDLGVRLHRNRPLGQLRPHATDVLRAALSRASVRLS